MLNYTSRAEGAV